MSEVVRPTVHRETTPQPENSIPAGIDAAPSPIGASQRRKRFMRRFRIPEKARVGPNDPTQFVIRELTVEEVEASRKIADGDRTRSVIEQTKLSLFSVDEHVVDHSRDEGSYFYNNWSQKVRELAVLAYDQVGSNTQAEVTDFLSSMESV